MSAGENDAYFDCSFVSIHYIICECGETFPSENGLKAHLEKEHPHKRERKEFKCGVCGCIYPSEDECITHYEESHIKQEDEDYQDEDDEEDTKPYLKDEQVTEEEPEQEQLLEDEIPMDQIEHLVMNEETGEFTVKPPTPEPQDPMTIKPHQKELVIKSVRSSQVKPKTDKLMIQSVKPDRIIVKPQPVMVTSGGGTEQQVVHIPEEYGQLLQMTPDGQLVIIMNNENTEDAESKQESPGKHKGRPKKLYGKHIVCEVCGKKYASNAALKYHQRVHTGEKPYHCHLCPKSFAMPLFLQIHIRTHTGERPFRCPECPKAFSNKAALLRHDRVHTGVKPYECPMCLKSFTQSNSLKLHVATVHLKQPAPYKSKNRKLKAQERAMKNNMADVTTEKKIDEEIQENENEDGEAARNIAVHSDNNMYEVIESEEVINEEKEVYTIIYEDE